jgi:hypothetical protein
MALARAEQKELQTVKILRYQLTLHDMQTKSKAAFDPNYHGIVPTLLES